MFKEFFIKKMLRARGASPEQAELMMTLVNKNPELFKKIAAEIEVKVQAGQNQQEAAMAVMLAHQAELQQLISS
jgi:hypothetical protein